MTRVIGANSINPQPCNEEDQQRNWQVLSDIISTIQQKITGGGEFQDTFKVKVSPSDLTENYLHAKHFFTGTYDSEQHAQVFADIVSQAGVETVRLFTPVAAGSDTYQIKINEADSEPGYIEDKIAAIIAALIAGGVIRLIAITEEVLASAFDSGLNQQTPTFFAAPYFHPNPIQLMKNQIKADKTMNVIGNLNVSVTAPASGKFKRAIVIFGWLIAVSCIEEDLPDDFND